MTYQTFRFNPSLLRKCHLNFFRLSGVPSYSGAWTATGAVSVLGWCNGNFELLHFFKAKKSKYPTSTNHKAEISVEGRNFYCTSLRRCARELKQT